MTDGTQAGSGGGAADLAFVHGGVYTVDAVNPRAEAVAVRGGTIVAVGTDEEIRERIDRSTEVVDLAGRMLLPGFQDAHVHPPSGGVEMLRCNLSDAYSLERYERIVAAYAAEHRDAEWIEGGGWSMDVFPGGAPSKKILDRLVPGRPVYLPSRDGHSAWVSSRALELAGVGAATPDPSDGRIERDAEGAPTGTLHEGAMHLVGDLVPPTTEQVWEEGLRVAQRYLHSLGITAWQDAIVEGPYPTLDAYIAVEGRGELTARVVGALWWDRHRGDEQIEDLLAKRTRADSGRFRATSVKIMQDGIVENFTAATLTPYLDTDGRPTHNTGISFVEPETLKAIVTRLDAEGFQVHVHALADRAVREALDAIEAARRANGRNDLRHHIAHIQIVHPDDVPRFAELGVVANMQPLWATYEGQMLHLTIPFLGPERTSWQYPFASLARAGAVLAGGSDWSVSSPNPMWEMAVAAHRMVPSALIEAVGERATREPFLPEERLDLATALRAFTMGSAYVNHLDHVTGSIQVGKFADLVVVDRDPFEQDLTGLMEAQILLTLVEGERVHAAGEFA